MNYFTKDKPYNSLNEYLKAKYGKKVSKIALNGSFTCPNRDGSKGLGGCTFCSNLGSGDLAGDKHKSIAEQFDDIKKIMDTKWPNSLYIPYFQANSSTYKTLEELKRLYSEAIRAAGNNCVGLDIATRPDCINEEIASYLGKLNETIDITVELGLQSASEKTGERVNRCQTNWEFTRAVEALRRYNIEIVVHIINGLPGEDTEDMLNTIDFINRHDIQGIKFHSLLVLKNTKLEEEYNNGLVKLMTLEEYVDITVKQITYLRGDIIIHRLAADGVMDDLIEPKWTIKKLVVMNEIDKLMRKNKLYQGMNFKAELR